MASKKKPASTASTTKDAPKDRGGRPSTGLNTNLNLRVDPAKRETWQAATKLSGQKESDWVREGLDAWALITTKAHELGMNAHALVAEGVDARARVRSALAELRRPTLTATEQRLLRILDLDDWVRRFDS